MAAFQHHSTFKGSIIGPIIPFANIDFCYTGKLKHLMMRKTFHISEILKLMKPTIYIIAVQGKWFLCSDSNNCYDQTTAILIMHFRTQITL